MRLGKEKVIFISIGFTFEISLNFQENTSITRLFRNCGEFVVLKLKYWLLPLEFVFLVEGVSEQIVSRGF